MFNRLFGRTRKPDIVNPGSAAVFKLNGYQMQHQRQQLPDPGAPAYSWETLQLAAFTPIGPSIRTRIPFRPLAVGPQLYVNQAAQTVGIPTTSGGIVGQPLFNAGGVNV